MRTVAAIALLLTLSLIACQSAPKPPAWIKVGQTDEYPRIKFMVGVGEAADLDKARELARAEIAKQFNVKIQQLTRDLQEFTGMEGNKSDNWLLKTTVSELTTTFVAETVQGIEIAQTWSEKEGKKFYALAVLPRLPATQRLEERIADLDFKIKDLFKQSQGSKGKVERIRPLVQAIEVMKEREILNNQLSVVSPAGQGTQPTIYPHQLDKELIETLGSLKVAVVVDGDGGDRIRTAIVKSLTQGKISVQETAEGADILIKGQVTFKETNKDSKSDYVFAKYEANIDLKNQIDQTSFGVIEETYRDGALNESDAKDKTIGRLGKEIVLKFNDKFYKYLSL